jgi:hypothetical protein
LWQLNEEKIPVYADFKSAENMFKRNKYLGIKLITGFDYGKPDWMINALPVAYKVSRTMAKSILDTNY